MSFTPEQIAALDAPLAKSAVKERTQAGRALSYVEGWHVIAEANRIFGFDGWNRETIMLTETNRDLVTLPGKGGSEYQQWRIGYVAKVRVTVGATVREGTGYGSGMGKPEAIGDAVEGAIKEAETDAMKRALMTFGNPFGLALYDKTQENVEKAPPPQKQAPRAVATDATGSNVAPVRVAPNGADVAAAKMVDQINMAVTVEALESTKALIRPDFLRLPREQQKHVASAAEAKALALEVA